MTGSRLQNPSTNNEQKKTMWASNPVLRKLSGINEHVAENDCATYGGIMVKTFFFLLLSGVGFALYYFFAPLLAIGSQIVVEEYSFYLPQAGVACIAGLITLIVPILCWFRFIQPIIPVVGSLYCLCQGYLIGFLSYTFAGEYNDLIILALVITLAIVFVMLILYATKIVRPNKKFRTVLFTLFFTSIIASVLMLVLSLIPATRTFVNVLYGNPLISIGGSVLFIIIAALFLIVDFDVIRNTVENRLPKKYEWMASFGLAFTVIWLYLKVLDLLLKLKENN